ncbi:Transmembrane emp24 domain-containing protein 9 [Liparis tanakae]|uniref:Transmembrane emp24 domain-containing protein 9 n=1 Tax=Liparis tanakae TaxID=230148 RepID=A0A4Z2I461_9TELE|nr:Transmembrane emp24 domain-containing protein 9 [Liparis tanakae]
MLTLALLSALCGLASSVFLRVADKERACFTENLPSRTRLVGVYWTRLYDEQGYRYLPVHPDLEVNVLATDPDEQVLLSGSGGPEGNFSFTSRRTGNHRICLRSNSTRRPLVAGGALALHLDLRVGDRTNNYAQIAIEDKLTELQLRVRRLTEQVYHIQNNQDYYRLRLKEVHWIQSSTSRWIFWCVVVQTLCLVPLVAWSPAW